MSFNKNNPQVISQLDFGGVLRNAHDFEGQSLRIRDTVAAVQDYFTHYRATYNGNSNPTQVTYLLGIQPHKTEIGTISDFSGSLNNKYFFIYEPVSDQQYYIWYNVSGSGVNPSPGGIGVEVPIDTNDDSSIVALATELAIVNNVTASRFFDARRVGSTITIVSRRAGEGSDSIDGNTGFLFTNTSGEENQVEIVDITYNGNNPIWEGQELIGYKYNIFTGKFELLSSVDSINVDFAPVTAQTPVIVNLSLGLAGNESSTVLPVNTVKFLVKARGKSKLQLAYVSGQSGTNFITVTKGGFYSEEGLELDVARNIYIQAPNDDNEDVEIVYWT